MKATAGLLVVLTLFPVNLMCFDYLDQLIVSCFDILHASQARRTRLKKVLLKISVPPSEELGNAFTASVISGQALRAVGLKPLVKME